MGAGSYAGGGADGACESRGAGRDARGGAGWRSDRPDAGGAYTMSRPEGVKISFTSEAARMVESSRAGFFANQEACRAT